MRWSTPIVAFAVVCAAVACVKSAATECGNDLCPAGLACVSDHCVDPNVVTACIGVAENGGCTVGAGGSGVCQGGACIVGTCGDGIKNGIEECDLSDLNHEDCTFFGSPTPAGLKCNSDCMFDSSGCTQSCGNGHVEGNEQCDGDDLDQKTCVDYGFYGGTLSCTTACLANLGMCSGKCGNNTIEASEQCDGTDFGTPPKTCATLNGTAANSYPGPGTVPLMCTSMCTYAPESCTCGGQLCTPGVSCNVDGGISHCGT